MNRHGQLSGHAIYATTASRIVTEYGAAAGLSPATGSKRLSAHDLRRTAARNAHDNGASLLKVQAMLGHADPKTTALYIGLDEDDDDTATDYIRY
jgi:integrase